MPIIRQDVVGTKYNAQAPDPVLKSSTTTPPVLSKVFQAVEQPVVVVASAESDAASNWVGSVQISPDNGVTFTSLVLQGEAVVLNATNTMLTISVQGVFRISCNSARVNFSTYPFSMTHEPMATMVKYASTVTTGPQGAQGAQGSQGVQGAGAQGGQGVQGPQGSQGSQGSQGTQGTQGGSQGAGSQGPQGFQGVQGTSGAQGTQGSQGSQGLTGVGTSGLDGIDGNSATLNPSGVIAGGYGPTANIGTLATSSLITVNSSGLITSISQPQSSLQASFLLKIIRLALWNTQTPQQVGFNFNAASVASNTPASTNVLSSFSYAEYQTGAVTDTSVTANAASPFFWRGNAANIGGFVIGFTFGLTAVTTTMRIFCGLTSKTANVGVSSASWTPSNETDCFFVGADSADTNLQVMVNDNAGVCTKLDLGVNFPKTVNAMYSVILNTFGANGSSIGFQIIRLDTISSTFTRATNSFFSNLPTAAAFLNLQFAINTGTPATNCKLAMVRCYAETDNYI